MVNTYNFEVKIYMGDNMNLTEIRKKQLNGFGFRKIDNPDFPIGEYFYLDDRFGVGGYWLYDYKNMFTISIHDFYFHDDFYFSADMYVKDKPTYLSISHNISINGDFLNSSINPISNSITGVLYGENTVNAVIDKNTQVYSISIEIYPDYYDYLTDKFKLEKEYLKNALLSLKSDTDFYEMMILLQEIKNFKSAGISAEIFYESKVMEAVALILSKSSYEKNISLEDYTEIQAINKYILENLSSDISQKQICSHFFIGRTKLQNQFKKVNNCTISEFIKKNRIEKSKTLLKEDKFSIKDISLMVGYKNQSRFSEIFREYTNLLPTEYRQIFKI